MKMLREFCAIILAPSLRTDEVVNGYESQRALPTYGKGHPRRAPGPYSDGIVILGSSLYNGIGGCRIVLVSVG